jgi:hypothetical protein
MHLAVATLKTSNVDAKDKPFIECASIDCAGKSLARKIPRSILRINISYHPGRLLQLPCSNLIAKPIASPPPKNSCDKFCMLTIFCTQDALLGTCAGWTALMTQSMLHATS